MKILHISKKYPNVLGGDAVVVENLYRKQSNAGHEVLILTSNCNDTKVASNIYKFGFNSTSADLDVISIKRLASLVLLYFRAHKLISLNRPDIIHTHSVDMAYVVSSIARRYKIPIVHTFHILTFNDSNQSILRRKIELILLRCVRPKVITAPNEHDVSALVRAGMSQAVTVPNGIELDFWKRYPKTKHEIYTYITVGRLELQKGLDFLIYASAILKQSSMISYSYLTKF